MLNILHNLEKKLVAQLHLWFVLLSMLIAAQVQYIQHGWINSDSVLYLEAAKFFSNGEWAAGFEVFPWPFYSLCITLVDKITQVGVHISAQILNALFFAIASYSFIRIIQLAGGKQRQIIAGALIWLSAQYMIGGVLEMLMRDEGFWAFYLLSIVFFIRFYQQHQLKDALLWQVCIIVATLFRIEAILYLIFLPFILLFQTGFIVKQKLRHLLSANAINIGLAVMIILVFCFNNQLSTKLLGRLNEVFTTDVLQQFTRLLIEKSSIMSKQVLGDYLKEFAIPSLLITFLFVICVRIISSTGLIIVILSIFAVKNQKRLFDTQAYQVLCATALIALFNMALIITKVFVLSGRYVLALSFILMVFAAFYFADLLFRNHQNKKVKWLVIALIVFMLGSAVKNILPKKHGYNYQQEAVSWLKNYNIDNKPVFYEDSRLRFYAGAPFIGNGKFNLTPVHNDSKTMPLKNYEFLVLNTSNEDLIHQALNTDKTTPYSAIKKFYSAKSKNSIVIYQRR
jgi:hypothetical protein